MKLPIIIEGPDACGKSTLAKAIIDQFGGEYIHLGYKDDDTLIREQWDSLVRAANSDKITVIDRHWISEQIYGSIYRGKVGADAHAPWQLNFFSQLEGIYIFCLPPVELAVLYHKTEHARREELFAPDDKFLRVVKAYHQFVYGAVGEDAFGVECLGQKIAQHGGFMAQEVAYVFDRSQCDTEDWVSQNEWLFDSPFADS